MGMSALLAVLAAAAGFVPGTYRDGDLTVLPVRFPDGTRAELRHPPGLRLAELGVEPYSSGALGVARDFAVRHGTVADVMAGLNGTRLRTYPSGASYWATRGGHARRYLAFQFGQWAVLVYDYPRGSAAMTPAQRAAWARSLRGRETRRGFLRLIGRGRLRLAEAGEHAGPELSFGSPGGRRWVALYPGRCRPIPDADRRVGGKRVSWDGRFASWCVSRDLRAHARGRRRFVFRLVRGLEARVRPPRMRTYVRALGWSDSRCRRDGAAPGVGRDGGGAPVRRTRGARHPISRDPEQERAQPSARIIARSVRVDRQPVSWM